VTKERGDERGEIKRREHKTSDIKERGDARGETKEEKRTKD